MADGSLGPIEDRVVAARSGLSQTLDRLSRTVSPEQLSETAQGYGGELGQQAWNAARGNPAAFALVGAGLALLLSGPGTARRRPSAPPTAVDPAKAMAGLDERIAKADAQMKSQETGQMQPQISSNRMHAALDRGLEKLPDHVRDRVLKLRKSAILTQERLEQQAAKAKQASSQVMQDQPIAVGAVAFGVGALIAAMLPGTRREDDLLGARRDAFMNEANAILRSEMDAAKQQADARLFGHDQDPAAR